jgi:hypothetical protein
MGGDQNGWNDVAEAEREALDVQQPCVLASAAEHIAQSQARIARTSGKWKAMTA